MNSILALSIIIIISYFFATLLSKYGFPRVSIYVLFGALLSKNVFGNFLNVPHFRSSEMLINISLGIIAFLIGLELNWEKIKSLGKTIFLSAFGEVLGASFFVFAGISLLIYFHIFDFDYRVALILGGIAATTAPAGTMSVINQYNAKGLLVTILLGIVILDDAIGVILFEFVTSLVNGGFLSVKLFYATLKLLEAAGIGAIFGLILGTLSRLFRNEELRFPFILGFILLCVSLTFILDLSSILSCIFLGFVTQLVTKQKTKTIILPIKHIEEFIFIIFFVFAGMHFDSQVFLKSITLMFAYIIFRGSGKYFGARLGARLGGANKKVSSYLGFGLFPQAGVAVGLAISISHKEGLETYAPVIFNVILSSTIIFEILGPFFTKFAFEKTNEV